jgi:hypothetical protein
VERGTSVIDRCLRYSQRFYWEIYLFIIKLIFGRGFFVDIKTFYIVEMWAFISEKLRLHSVFYESKSMHILIYTFGKF